MKLINRMYRIIFTIIIFFILQNNGFSQKTNFYAQSDAKEILTDSYLEIRFILENDEGHSFRPPEFNGFKIISGPNQSNQISIVNGKRSSKTVYSFVIIAQKQGTYIINPAKITVGKSVLKSNTLKVIVKKKVKSNLDQDPSEKFFVKAELSDSICYPGQQVILKYKLYTSVNVSNYSFRKESGYDGFLTRVLNISNEQERIIIGNSEYLAHTLKTIALFPQKTGKLDISSADLVIHLPDKRNRNQFFQSTKRYPTSSEEITLQVLPLPENKLVDFSGNIGKFDIKTKINNNEISTDDAFSLLVQIEGNGQTKFIEAPKFNESLKNFEVYDPKLVNQKEYISEGKLFSKKTFEYLLVPLKPGTFSFKIPFNYFDTDSAKYITLHSRPKRITVKKGKGFGKQNKKDVISKYQLKPLMTDNTLKSFRAAFFGSSLYLIILMILFLCIPIMYFYRRHLIQYNNLDPKIKKRRKAGKIALKRLKKAKELMNGKKVSLFYKEISDALLKYISDKLDISNIELSKSNVKIQLDKLGFSDEKSNDFYELLEICELALFADSPNSDMNSVFNSTKELLTNLEMEL